jgi:hypothetical protein
MNNVSTETNEPSQSFLRAKRWLVLSSAGLLLSVTVGLEVDSDNTAYPLPIRDTGYINEIIAIIVSYFIVQINIYWYAQNLAVREKPQFRFDYFSTISIAAVAIFSWIVNRSDEIILYASAQIGDFQLDSDVLFALSGIISLLVSALSVIALFGFQHSYRTKLKTYLARKSFIDKEAREEISEGVWRLNFNPKNSNGEKEISFREDGYVGKGQNNNEYSWRLREGFLEIFNAEGQIFSRFKFIPEEGKFFHTNDEDTRSLPDQVIERITTEG